MKKLDRYGVSDLVINSRADIPKYITLADSKGTKHQIEIYFIATEDENGNEV